MPDSQKKKLELNPCCYFVSHVSFATGLLLGASAIISVRRGQRSGRICRAADGAAEGAVRELPLPPGKPGNAFLDLLKYVKARGIKALSLGILKGHQTLRVNLM